MSKPHRPPGVRRLHFAVLALVATLSPGCRAPAVAHKEAYPLGMFAVRNPKDFEVLRCVGFNLVVGDASERFLDAAAAAGLRVVATPGTSADRRPFDERRAAEVVRRFDRHPALLAWSLSDEPDLHRIPPARIRSAQACIRRFGGVKPTCLTLFHGREAASFTGITDWLILDRYPIPWLPLADYPKHLRMGRLAAGPDRPVLAVVQAFDWSVFPELLPVPGPRRPPTLQEMRAMTYLALLEGMNGLLFYSFDDSRWRIREHPETWEALKRVVSEIRAREPLFQARLLWRDFDVRYAPGEESRNEALDPVIQAGRVRVRGGTKSMPSGDYVVAVNTVDRPVTWSVGWPGCEETHLPVLGEPTGLPGQRGWFNEIFEPYGVRVWGPLPPGCRRTGVRP